MKSNVIEISNIKDATNALKSQCARADHPLRNSRHAFGKSVLDSEGEQHRQSKKRWSHEFGQTNLNEHILEIVQNAVSEGFTIAHERDDLFLLCDYIPHKTALKLLGRDDVDPIAHSERIKPVSDYLEYSAKTEEYFKARDYLMDPRFIENNTLFSGASDSERRSEVALFLVAGTETTVIAMKILMCRWADDYEGLHSEVGSKGLTGAIMSALIQDSPLGNVTRFCPRSTTFGDSSIGKGDLVTIDICNANKKIFEEQQSSGSKESLSHNLVFGAGRHACPGKKLALLELELFLGALLTLHPSDYDVVITGKSQARPTTLRHPPTRHIGRRKCGA